MERIKKFVDDHKELVVGTSFGVLFGVIVGLEMARKGNIEGMTIKWVDVKKIPDGPCLMTVEHMNGLSEFLKLSDDVTKIIES